MFRFLLGKLSSKRDDQTFWDHAEILRGHLIRIIIALSVFSVAAFFFKDFIFSSIIAGPLHKEFITYKWICKFGQMLGYDSFCFQGMPLKLINIEIGGQFRWHMILSLTAGAIITFPYAIWELWRFIKPALKPNELKYSRMTIFYISILFFIGVIFGYYIVLPMSVNFLANYILSPDISNQITISSYISTVSVLPLSIGLVFELPVLVFFLTRIGFLTPKFMKKYRRHAIVIILLIAGIITPSTDAITQTLVSLPLYALYELSINTSKRVYRKMQKEMDAQQTEV